MPPPSGLSFRLLCRVVFRAVDIYSRQVPTLKGPAFLFPLRV